MRFLDLEKLKIIKDYNFRTIEIDVNINNLESTVIEIKEACYVALMDKFEKSDIETNYHINLITPAVKTTEEIDEEFFTTFVNIFSAIFFTNLCINKGRPRERRLDVPEKLKIATRASLTLLKRAINSQTYTDKFNLEIEWHNEGKEYHYCFIDQEYEDVTNNTIEKEFKHELDELESAVKTTDEE